LPTFLLHDCGFPQRYAIDIFATQQAGILKNRGAGGITSDNAEWNRGWIMS
jgi:hypothetical protein